MTNPFEKKAKLTLIKNDDDERTGTTSQGGAIEFHDFVNLNGSKLSSEEERQRLIEHQTKNNGLVDNQKKLRDQRKEIKLRQDQAANYQYGLEMESRGNVWETHPIIGKSAEFDGADPQVSLDPNYNEADTNNDKKQELTLQYQHRLELNNQPRHTPPTLKPPGS